MPHRTTNHSSAPSSRQGPWLVSPVCGRTACGSSVKKEFVLVSLRISPAQRWGYVVVAPDPDHARTKPPRSNWVIRATLKGRKAQEVWRPLFDMIEKRWRERFGGGEIEQLRESLGALIGQITVELPDCLSILGYGLFSRGPARERLALG